VGTNGFSSNALSGSNVSSGAITGQTIFTLSCSGSGGTMTPLTQTVSLVPVYIEQ
jgi:hypothetical protein